MKKRLAEPGLVRAPKQRLRGKVIAVNKHGREAQHQGGKSTICVKGQCWLGSKWLFCKLAISEFSLEIGRWLPCISAALAAFQGGDYRQKDVI